MRQPIFSTPWSRNSAPMRNFPSSSTSPARVTMFNHCDMFFVDATIAEAIKVLFSTGWIIAVDRMGHFIEIQPHEHRSETQAVISMKMANKNAGHSGRRNIGKNKLPLGSLSRIEKQPLRIPANKISAVIAKAGRLLARTAQNNDIPCTHGRTF